MLSLLVLILTGMPAGEDPEVIAFPDPVFGGEVRLRRDRERVSGAFIDGRGNRRLFHEDEVAVRFRSGSTAPERDRALRRIGGRLLRRTRGGEFASASLPPGLPLSAAIDLLLEDGAVRFAEPSYLRKFEPHSTPPRACPREAFDDPLLPSQWAVENPGGRPCFTRGADLDLPGAWAITCGSEKVAIAVLDSGIDLDHPDLRGQILPRGEEDWNFTLDGPRSPADSFGHGTAVAGLAAAAGGNGEGIVGAAPGCRLLPLKVDGVDLVMNFVDALDYLVEYGGRYPGLRLVVNGSFTTGDSIAARDAVARARSAGLVLFFSSGNSGGPVDYPAAYPEAVAVGAVGPDGSWKGKGGCGGEDWASNHGPELDLVAPGALLVTTDMTGAGGRAQGDYDSAFGGTSASSPLVAGVAALMLSINPRLAPERVREILIETAVDQAGDPREDSPGFDEFMGWGRVHAGRAVARAAAEGRGARGDADCDGTVALGDVMALLAALFEGRPAACPGALDANADGGVGITDPIYLVRWLFQGGPPPPPG